MVSNRGQQVPARKLRQGQPASSRRNGAAFILRQPHLENAVTDWRAGPAGAQRFGGL